MAGYVGLTLSGLPSGLSPDDSKSLRQRARPVVPLPMSGWLPLPQCESDVPLPFFDPGLTGSPARLSAFAFNAPDSPPRPGARLLPEPWPPGYQRMGRGTRPIPSPGSQSPRALGSSGGRRLPHPRGVSRPLGVRVPQAQPLHNYAGSRPPPSLRSPSLAGLPTPRSSPAELQMRLTANFAPGWFPDQAVDPSESVRQGSPSPRPNTLGPQTEVYLLHSCPARGCSSSGTRSLVQVP